MDHSAVIIGVCGLFLTVVNLLVGVIIAYIFKAISRLEDRHVNSVKDLHVKIEKHKEFAADKREEDLNEMRKNFEEIKIKLSSLMRTTGA